MDWTDAGYGTEKLDLGIVEVSVFYAMVAKGEPTGYRYRYGNFSSKALYPSLDEAKAAALESVGNRLLIAQRRVVAAQTEGRG